MAKRLQHRGGTTAQHSTFTGAVREVTVDTDKNTLVVHDGATAGGHPLATATNFTSTGIDDNATSTAITIDSSQRVGIGTASPTATLDVRNTSPIIQTVDLDNNAVSRFDGNAGWIALNADNNNVASGTNITFNIDGTEKMRIKDSGNVGIGTSSPQAPLHIVGTSSLSTEFKIGNSTWNTSNSNSGLLHQYRGSDGYSELQINSATTSPTSAFMIRNSTGIAVNFINDGASTFNGKLTVNDTIKANDITNRTSLQGIDATPTDNNNYELGAGYLNLYRDDNAEVNQIQFGKSGTLASAFSTGADYLAIKTNGDNERMRIDGSGNVGIGTTSPSDTANRVTLELNDTWGGRIRNSIGGTANSDWSISTSNMALFGTIVSQPLAFTTNNLERMRIDSSGKLGVNTSAPDTGAMQTNLHDGNTFYGLTLASSNSSGTQYHQRFLRGGTSGAMAGYITSNSATTIAFNNSSDERLKENIQNSGSAIQDIKDIQVRQFDWIDNIDTHRDFGFVAQELVNVVPEAVTQGTDELDENGKPVRSWGVDYSHIVPRLVKVCQEQQTKIEDLEARITALETTN